ncbi:MAG: hypothetical protein KatS3mg060_3453 [Dehalococcoidia bacterium]|nr:MAG: hypothetical protein KatS3mg060_3453 [Dehalococcoidia bacterium]
MHRWQDEDGGQDGPARRRVGLIRVLVGQALIVAVIGGALAARSLLPNAEPRAQTLASAGTQPTALPATSISARPNSQVPDEVATLGRRFLTALARGDLVEARRDVATGSVATLSARKLEGAATAFQSARARSFRVLFWQVADSAIEPARLTLSFDYDRADTGESRSRVELRVVQQGGRWLVADLDINAWMIDMGIGRNPG